MHTILLGRVTLPLFSENLRKASLVVDALPKQRRRTGTFVEHVGEIRAVKPVAKMFMSLVSSLQSPAPTGGYKRVRIERGSEQRTDKDNAKTNCPPMPAPETRIEFGAVKLNSVFPFPFFLP